MRGGLLINPWRTSELKNALSRALEKGRSERADRMRRNLEFSTRLTTANWTLQVLQDLKSVEKSEDMSSYSAMGFGMGFRVMGVKSGFKTVDISAISKSYRNSHSRLILLDWGGTLVAENEKVDKLHAYAIAQGSASRTGPTTALKDLLETLCADPRNNVFVVSGKEIVAVSEFFGDIKGLGLGAEHGFYYRWPQTEGKLFPTGPGSPTSRYVTNSEKPFSQSTNSPSPTVSKWQSMMPMGDQSWKESAEMIMDIYVQRTHGFLFIIILMLFYTFFF
jgi:trehalose 6-phosphate synthase/phosphatase